jgi:copper oxidase (laccase) domain-containing protein
VRECVTQRDGRLHFDLAAANLRFLLECGIPRDRIETADLCTYDHPELLHSYRRDGPGGGHHGLVAAIRSCSAARSSPFAATPPD